MKFTHWGKNHSFPWNMKLMSYIASREEDKKWKTYCNRKKGVKAFYVVSFQDLQRSYKYANVCSKLSWGGFPIPNKDAIVVAVVVIPCRSRANILASPEVVYRTVPRVYVFCRTFKDTKPNESWKPNKQNTPRSKINIYIHV